MDISNKLLSRSSKISADAIKDASYAVWKKFHMHVFYLLLAASLIAGAYIWKQSIYGSGWSEEKKQEYRNSQSKGVVLKEKEFEEVVRDVQERQTWSATESMPMKNIFKSY